jgi:iron complex transport system permease protein
LEGEKMKSTSPWFIFQTPKFSMRVDKRIPLVLGLVFLVAFIILVLHVGVGEYNISPVDVLNTLLGREVGDKNYHFVVMELRLPRAIVAWLVGAALGASGAIVQGLTRNPLASPDLTGVTAGASAAAVLLIIFMPEVPKEWLPIAAFAGGVLVAIVLYMFAWRSGSASAGDSPIRLILVGIGLSSVLGAFVSFALTFGDLWYVQSAMMWLSGSVYASDWADINSILPWILICLPLAFFTARDLNALNLGEDVAHGLGLQITLKRGFLLLLAVALAGVTVTVAGIIAFVGLIAPHLARRLVGSLHEGLIPASAFVGGFVVILADLIGRTITPPTEIPAGIITSIIGVPFLLYLLWKREKV